MSINNHRISLLTRMAAAVAAMALFAAVNLAEADNRLLESKSHIKKANTGLNCSFQVSPPADATAIVRYVKGDEWAKGYAIISDDRTVTTIEAIGGRGCIITKVRLDTKYSVREIEPGSRIHGPITRSGDGFYPVAWALAGMTARTGDEEPVKGEIFTLYDRADGRALSFDKYGVTAIRRIVKRRVQSSEISFNHGFLVAPKVSGSHGAFMLVPMSDDVPIIAPIVIGVDALAKVTRVDLDVQTFAGDGLYNFGTGKRDDSVAHIGEWLSAGAIMTITAS